MFCTIAPTPPETVIRRKGAFSYWKSPYKDQDFLDALQATILATDRRWYSDRCVWAIRSQHTELLADLVERFYLRRPEIEEALWTA